MKRLLVLTRGELHEFTVQSVTVEAGGVLVLHEFDDQGSRVRLIAQGAWTEATAEEIEP